jgi:hypothetical protein
MPRVGTADNYAYPTGQLNIAPAVAYESATSAQFLCLDMRGYNLQHLLHNIAHGLPGMGHFGESHRDKKDDLGGLSCMISNTHIPEEEGYEWGRLHLLAFGVYIVLQQFRVMNFSSLRRHGGTPPLSPPGVPPAADAYRVMTVLYPPSSMLSGAGNYVIDLATLNKSGAFSISPEMSAIGCAHL